MSKPVARNAGGGVIREVSLESALGERYLAYALSTITARSLPDARDGLKPVHRRLLYAMRLLRLDPASGYKKCARVVGDVIGKFHPHGEQAVYDAMVRLSQEFAARYPLVDGQGNFGNIDGDGAAAMRYTEARLTPVAEALLDGIDEDTVEFRATYDGEEDEPLVLPAAFPNLLANGASGIAVGMATSIPPHNAGELCDALLHLIKSPRATAAKIADLVPGPDFPTGGVLVESRQNIVAAYRSGRGSFRLRARWEVEKQGRGLWVAVVTEMPYQVAKSRLVERIAELIAAKKVPLLGDVRDESAEDVRLVLEPRSRTVEPEVLMESLFRATDLEVRVPLNLNVLDGGRLPRVLDLRGALQAFLDHRHEVLVRRTRTRLARAEARVEVLEGYLLVFGNLDEVIRILRTEDEPRAVLKKRFKLSDAQTDAILDLRLRRLRRLEEEGIRAEHADLTALSKKLRALQRDKGQRWQTIATEIREIREAFGAKTELGGRRTTIADPPALVEVPTEAMIEREPITVVCSEKGWIRAMKGHVEDTGDVRYKDGDRGRFWLHAQSTDRISIFVTNGRFHTLVASALPRGRGMGEPVKLMADLSNGAEIVDVRVHRPGAALLVASSDGRGFVVEDDQTVAQTRQGRQVLNLAGGAEAAVCVPADGDTVAVIGENRKLLLFPLSELPTMARGRGVLLQRYRDGALADARVFRRKDGLSWRSGERVRTETDLRDWLGKRAQSGRLPPRGFPKSGRFS
ncbi:MAG: DNA topoisomerase IV subunit A [Proteobacteria bacterium]|nr:DNA topoisomerase IV subunit A [Pseudomonadota bacterium]MDA1132715.1 DNA topoisomerase IV subunit A [Pseudomonadota bacterium]